MTKLEKLYSIIENSREVGVNLNKDVLQQVEDLEEGIIKEDILPALGNDIAPRLEPIKRDLVLVVEYHPGEPISVALSRKTKISEMTGAKMLTPRSSTPVKGLGKPEEVTPHEPAKHIENFTKGMKVTFPDGIVIWHRQAIDTFIDTLRKIGLERIPVLGIKHGRGYNLVSKNKRPPVVGHIWQHECDGWYIYSNISNAQKIADLKCISDYYHLGLKIEEGKPEQKLSGEGLVTVPQSPTIKEKTIQLPVTDFAKSVDAAYTILIKSESRRVRNIANAAKGKYRTAMSVVENCYPFQTDEGILCAKKRIEDGTCIWVEKKLTATAARVVVRESLNNFIKYGGAPEIMRVVVGAPVE